MVRVYVLLLLAASLTAACGSAPADAESGSQSSGQALQPTAAQLEAVAVNDEVDSDPAPDGVIATVNGVAITTAAYNQMLTRRSADVEVANQDALENFVLTTLINQELTVQAAGRMEITVTDAEVDAEIVELKALIGDDETAWQNWLEQNQYTEAEFREELQVQLLTVKVRDIVVGDAPLQTTQQVHARHILVDTEAQASEVRERLGSGESFVDLAAEYSKDVTTRNEGGDLGWFAQEELLEPLVAEVAFSQQPGDISEPVATRLGYHIIETLAFDDLPLQPEKQALVAQSIFDEWLSTQNDSAIIEVYR